MANAFGKGKMSSAEQERLDNYDAEHASHKAKMAGRQALAAKIRWGAIEAQWLATAEAYNDQAERYEATTGPNVTTGLNAATGTNATAGTNATTGINATTGPKTITGILATQDWDDNGVNGPSPPDRPLSVFAPDPDAIFDTYPAIRRGHWTHGGFPLDESFGSNGRVSSEPNEHSGFHRSADTYNHNSKYQPGTIISMMWHQDYALDTKWQEIDKSFLTLNRQVGVIFSKRRKFIVVARFQGDYIALPIWTSFADKLKKDEHRRQRVEFMQIIHQGDSIQEANKSKLTPYNYLFQQEKRRHPNTIRRQTSANSSHRHLEDDWLDMKPNGYSLLRLTFPVSFDYRVKCHIIGSLQPTSVEYLLKNWATEMQKSTLGHLLVMDRTPRPGRAREQDEASQTVDELTQRLHQELNIDSKPNSSGVWNFVLNSRQQSKLEARRAPLANMLEQSVRTLETAQTLISEATLYGAHYETAVDTMRVMQEAGGFIHLLSKIVAVPGYGGEIPPSPASQNGRSIGVNSPLSPFNSSWTTWDPSEKEVSREHGLGEPRFTTPGSNLRLTAGQHAQLGHTTQNTNPNWIFPQAKAPQMSQAESSKKRKKM